MASENETVEAVVTEIKGILDAIENNSDGCKSTWRDVFDRIESAWRREKAQVMQAATEVAMAPTQVRYEPKPRRNCDRFQNEDEADYHYRKEHNTAYASAGDFIRWLFAPVAEGGES